MNTGISLILQNADFSDSPLGTVTIVPSDKDRASAITDSYIASIESEAYRDAVYNLVLQMIRADLWDKTYLIAPILGDSLEHKCVTLKGPSIVTLSNASNNNNKLSFSSTITETSYSGNNISFDFLEKNRSVLFRASSQNIAASIAACIKIAKTATSGNNRYFSVNFQTSAALNSNSRDSRIAYTQVQDKAILLENGNKISIKDVTFASTNNNRYLNVVGAAVAADKSVSDAYDGTLSYYVIGSYNEDELKNMDLILGKFAHSTNKE